MKTVVLRTFALLATSLASLASGQQASSTSSRTAVSSASVAASAISSAASAAGTAATRTGTSSATSATSSASSTASATAGNNPLITSSPPEEIDLQLNLTSGPYDNYLIRSNLTAAQVLLTNTTATESGQLNRFLVALPAGNSGSVAYFLPLSNATNSTGSSNTTSASTNSASLTVTLGENGLKTAHGPNGLHGVTGELVFSESARLGTTLLGSVRTLRDYTEGNGLTHQIFNWTVTQADNSTIWFSKPWLNETIIRNAQGQQTGRAQYGLEWLLQANNGTSFNVTPSTNGTYTPPQVQIIVPSGGAGSVNFTVQVNETALAGLTVDQLFVNNSNAASQPEAESQFSFLTYSTKFTAGGWRFLTYFGRDTMFTTRLLMNNKTITPFAIESVLGGVLERINITSGQVCHEETIGDYATFVNIGEGHPERGNEPFYDYKMKDTHFVLLPQLADYLLRYNATSNSTNSTLSLQASSEARQFLNRSAVLQNGTSYAALLDANIAYVMNSSQAFAANPNATNLARIQAGVPVGNWRDSNQGLGWGVYPYDVSTALVPAALYAISDLAQAGLLSNVSIGNEAARYAQVWEEQAHQFFQYTVPAAEVMPRLEQYVQLANLSESLLYGSGSLNSTSSTNSTSNSTTSSSVPTSTSSLTSTSSSASANAARRGMRFAREEFGVERRQASSVVSAASSIASTATTASSTGTSSSSSTSTASAASATASSTSSSSNNVTLYGLSLLENGTVVPVQNSDLSFNLLFNRNISRSVIEAVIQALQPYPRGLLTNVGMLVANPAYDTNRTKTTELDRTAYHGTVSWGFQTNFMASGLERVLASCNNVTVSAVERGGLIRADWCDDEDLVQQLQDAQTSLWNAVNGAFEERFAEVWSWTFDNSTERFNVTALGDISPEGTESDAVQLWSYGLLGLQDPTKASAANSTQ